MGIPFRERAAKKQAATQALTTWYADAGVIAELFEQAGMPLPLDVATVLGIGSDETDDVPSKPVQAPYQRPPHIPPHWLSVPLGSVMPITLVRVALHGKREPVRVKDVIAQLRAVMPERMIEESQVYTIGNRLKRHEVIDYAAGMSWVLRDPDGGPQAIDGRVWGPKDAFTLPEIAIHRREALIETLKANGPLTRTEILGVLKISPWAEFSQPLLTKDLETLEEKRIVTKNAMNDKWELLPEAKQQVEAETTKPLARVHRIGASIR